MIYTVTTVETDRLSPEIQTKPYDTLEKAIAAIEDIIESQELLFDAEYVNAQLAELKEYEYGDLSFEADCFYINLDNFECAY